MNQMNSCGGSGGMTYRSALSGRRGVMSPAYMTCSGVNPTNNGGGWCDGDTMVSRTANSDKLYDVQYS